jgi:hypothetical protein
VFEERVTECEWMDGENFDEGLAERSFRFIEMVNRFFGGVRIVRRFIADQADGGTIKVLDIGSGSCDIPLAVSLWAERNGMRVHFTCIEKSETVAEIARRRIRRAGDPLVKLIREDIFDHRPAEPYDCAVGSMFFHHLDEEQILGLVRHLRTMVTRSLLINDLRRSLWGYLGCMLLARGFPPDVRHDALLSIRKGFKEIEMRKLLQGLEDVSVDVRAAHFFRVQAVVQFHTRMNG